MDEEAEVKSDENKGLRTETNKELEESDTSKKDMERNQKDTRLKT